jgi:hypothetical protein
MPEFTATISFSVYCTNCGAGLCNTVTMGESLNGDPIVNIEPCAKCLKERYDEGYEDGETAERENHAGDT